jgi:hypothetical protein
MPIQKFKTFEEAEKALFSAHPDDAYFARITALWNFAHKLNRISYPKGIFKFRTIEEANNHREQLELAHLRKKQKEIRAN